MDSALLEPSSYYYCSMPPLFSVLPWSDVWNTCLDLLRLVIRFAIVGVAGVVLATVWFLLSILSTLVPHCDAPLPPTVLKWTPVDTHGASRERLSQPASRKSDHSSSSLSTPGSLNLGLVQPPVGSHVRFSDDSSGYPFPPLPHQLSRDFNPTLSPILDNSAASLSDTSEKPSWPLSEPVQKASKISAFLPPYPIKRKEPSRVNSAPSELPSTPVPGQSFENIASGEVETASEPRAVSRCREKTLKRESSREPCSKGPRIKQNSFPTSKPHPLPLPPRTNPYQAPYFFPSPASPEAATYVHLVRSSRLPARSSPIVLYHDPPPAGGHTLERGVSASASSSRETVQLENSTPPRSASTVRRRSWHLPLHRRPISIGSEPRLASPGMMEEPAEPSPRAPRSRFRIIPHKSHAADEHPAQPSPSLSGRRAASPQSPPAHVASDGAPVSEDGRPSSRSPPSTVRRLSWRERLNRRASSFDASRKPSSLK